MFMSLPVLSLFFQLKQSVKKSNFSWQFKDHKNIKIIYIIKKKHTFFVRQSVCQSVRHHFVLTGKNSGHKTVATRFSVPNSNLLINKSQTCQRRSVWASFFKQKMSIIIFLFVEFKWPRKFKVKCAASFRILMT